MHSLRLPKRLRPIRDALLLALVSAFPASAQYCYVFSSSAAGISVTANITVTGQNVMNSDPPGETRLILLSYTGTYSETIGNLTLTGSGSVTNADISFEGVPGITPWTNLLMGTPSFLGALLPAWTVSLFGTGDLLPNGLTPQLPPISAWQYTPEGTAPPGNHLTIFGNGVTIPQNLDVIVDGISSCSGAGGGGPSPKALGNVLTCVLCGEPINLGTGNLYTEVRDYRTVGGNPLGFIRYYNSMASSTTFASTLGANWRSNYDRYLRIGSATSVTAERADGQQLTFTASNGVWTTDSDVDVTLTNSGATWTLTDHDDTIETYNAAGGASEGVLQTIQARNGYTQTLNYTGNQLVSVTDSFGRQLSFTYSSGLLQTVSTPDGEVLTYGYTGSQLTSISYPTSPVTSQTYVYENPAFPNALTGVFDENGNRFNTWSYDSGGRAISSQDAGGADLLQVTYNDTDGSRTVTNPLGGQAVYKFSTLQGIPKVTEVDRTAAAGVAAATRKFTYDNNGYMASQTDWNGNSITYVNDVHGQPTSIVEASGSPQARTTTITYHPTFHLPARIVTAGLTSAYTYDNYGELLGKTLVDTTTTATPYATAGQTRTWSYTWSNFELVSVKRPRTDVSSVISYTYDASGALTGVTNALGQTTQITQFMPGGLPQTLVDPNGVTTNLSYDPRLRLLSSTTLTAAGPLTTSYTYDAAEQLTAITLPDGSTVTNTFDGAHRLTGVTDLFGQSATYVLDAQGDRIQTNLMDANGNSWWTHAGVFDAVQRIQQDIGGAGQTTTITYDSNGNATSATDPLGNATQRTFDALNRLATITDAAKGVAVSTFDAHDRLLSLTAPNGAVTTLVYDGFGDVIERVSPDSGMTVYRYDLDGNLTQRVDGAGAVTNYAYDQGDRLVTVSYPVDPAENVALTYDQGNLGIGRLTGVSDAAGTLTQAYDERGNVVSEMRVNIGVMLTTAYTYDAASRVTSITYPSGWTAVYARDAMGRSVAVTAQAPGGGATVPVLGGVTYQPFGPVNGFTFGNGIGESRGYDQDYRLTNLADAGTGAVQSLTYAYDAANNVSSVADGVNGGNSQTFGYDVLNRLISAAGAYGTFGYTYDSAGNRLNETGTGSTAVYAYTAKSNQLASVSANGAAQPIGYDKAGNANSFGAVTAGAITGATYNQAGRLSAVTAGGNVSASYTYDAFGRRLTRVGAVTGTTLYQYDRGGQLIEETDDEGNPLADYVYLGDLPVATISPATGQIYFLHTDRLETPQLATDSNQNVVWSAGYGPFGEMASVPAGIVQNLRMPGQEYDAETGLYHNGFRDYAPGLGRYLQSDPVGLAGGLNTYAYAGANPLRWVDRYGLQKTGEDIVLAAPPSLAPANDQQWARYNAFWANSSQPPSSDMFYVAGHGNPYAIEDAAHDGGAITAEQLAAIIQTSLNYQPGETVRLDSCLTGRDTGTASGPFAQQLADALGATVLAPNGFVMAVTGPMVLDDGTVVQSTDGTPLVFQPKASDPSKPDTSGPSGLGTYLTFRPRSSTAGPII